MACPEAGVSVGVNITDVQHRLLKEVSKEDYLEDGFKNPEDMLSGMRQFYPKMDYESPVTVIKWDNVWGKLVDDPSYL